ACEYIAQQLRGLHPDLHIDLEPLPPEQLYRKVEIEHDYDLAYYQWDYATEDYWLWPLVDPRGVVWRTDATGAAERRKRNFLGYKNGPLLKGLFGSAMDHREFKVVRQTTHDIHERFVEQMPLIPLWQLDTHIVFQKELTPVGLDPLLVFTHVEEWRLEK